MNRVLLPLLVSSVLGVACSSKPTDESDMVMHAPEDAAKPERPVVDELSASLGADGALGLLFAGRVGLGPTRVVEVELLDAQGQAFHVTSGWFPWLARPARYSTFASFGHLEADTETFRGVATFVDTSIATLPRRVRVRFGERTELMGDPRESEVGVAAPVVVEQAARCDPFEVVNRCEEGTLCDVASGVVRDSPTCSVPAATCPLQLPVLESVYMGSNADAPDDTLASCTWSRGNLGREQGHVFSPPSSGTYRFTAESISEHAATTLFVRRYCEYAHAASERGCTHEREHDGGPLVLDVPLLQGETSYVFVESWWANGGDYVLSVERVD
jgi:hypothetical protein